VKLNFKFFERVGKENTDESLALAKINAENNGINDIVVASTWGNTAKKVSEIFDPSLYNIVIVTHSYGFRENTPQEFNKDLKKELESKGIKIFSGTMAFSGVGSSMLKSHQYWDFVSMYARTIRTVFCDGVKVCHEIVLMAADAGLITHGNDVISIGGTGTGADTVCLIKAAPSRKFLEARIKAILAKPL
jgi:hypothetical protein